MKKMMIALLFTFIFPGKIAQARDYDAPETAVSFFFVKRNVDAYFDEYKQYPKYWTDFPFQYSCNGFMNYDKTVYPRRKDSISWKPRRCEFEYKITSGGKNRFEVSVLDSKNKLIALYQKKLSEAWIYRVM